MKPINVFSLFDGMSCGQLALQKSDIPVGTYHASEIDKWAIKITQKNFPYTLQMGDITKLEDARLEIIRKHIGIDLVMGGSPCQGFSFAGKNLNFEDPRSKLFFDFVRVLKILKPKYFLLENVRMKKESQDVISEYLGVEPVAINSNLVSAQNRHRLYWTNIPFDMPKDKGIILADILEDGVTDREKSHCLDANYFKGGNLKSYFEKHRRQLVFNNKGGAIRGRYDKDGKIKQQLELRPDDKTNSLTTVQKDNVVVSGCIQVGTADLKGHDIIKRVYSRKGKAPTLNTMNGGNREPKVICGQMIGRKINPKTGKRDDYNPNIKTEQRIELKGDGKSGALTTVQKDNLVVTDKYWRSLTPKECERLQTLADDYTMFGDFNVWSDCESDIKDISKTQRYKMLGNGWCVDVVTEIFKGLKNG